MNRRNILSLLVGSVAFPCSLFSAPPKKRPPRPSCKDCKKCGRLCKCECSKGCKCKPGCCKTDRSPDLQKPRGFDGKTPDFRPPNSRPPSGFDRRTPGFGPPSDGKPSGRPSRGKHLHHRIGPHSHPQKGGICPQCKRPHKRTGSR